MPSAPKEEGPNQAGELNCAGRAALRIELLSVNATGNVPAVRRKGHSAMLPNGPFACGQRWEFFRWAKR